MKSELAGWITKAAVVIGIAGLCCAGVAGVTASAEGNEKTVATSETADAGDQSVRPSRSSDEYIYCVGSVSKVYAVAAVMKLADEGRVDPDRPVTDYLPAFKMADERYRDITVRMLMNHTSGIMGTSQIGSFLYADANTWHHDHLLENLAGQRLKADPGAYASYCNDGFDLLELIVENVTGMSYTEYVSGNIAAPTGGSSTCTGLDYSQYGDPVPAYSPENLLYDQESCMCLGAGGVYGTASDVARFGASFFTGNDALLSENSRDEMAACWNNGSDDYLDGNGLGWDYVSMKRYEEEGVRVLGKGGDVLLNHAFLMVAPDEEISVAVLSNGGSSMYNGMLAEVLMDTVLGEEGINPVSSDPEYEVIGSIPAEYEEYAGYYATQNALDGGAAVCRITFPEHRYMHVESISPVSTSVTDYACTAEGEFAELAYEVGDGGSEPEIAVNPDILRFVRNEAGSVYITCKGRQTAPGLGDHDRRSYIGERMEAASVSDEVLHAWEEVCGRNMFLCNDVSSSANYQSAMIRAYMCREVPGYVFVVTGLGTRLLKIIDSEHAAAFQTIPSSANRDLIDVTIRYDKDTAVLVSSSGPEYLFEDALPEFDGLADEADLSGSVSWFRISDRIANSTVSIEKPAGGAIYVYNKYGDTVYTTHVRDASSDVPMPKGGFIVFLQGSGN